MVATPEHAPIKTPDIYIPLANLRRWVGDDLYARISPYARLFLDLPKNVYEDPVDKVNFLYRPISLGSDIPTFNPLLPMIEYPLVFFEGLATGAIQVDGIGFAESQTSGSATNGLAGLLSAIGEIAERRVHLDSAQWRQIERNDLTKIGISKRSRRDKITISFHPKLQNLRIAWYQTDFRRHPEVLPAQTLNARFTCHLCDNGDSSGFLRESLTVTRLSSPRVQGKSIQYDTTHRLLGREFNGSYAVIAEGDYEQCRRLQVGFMRFLGVELFYHDRGTNPYAPV